MKLYIYIGHPELFAKGSYSFSLKISDCDDLARADYSGCHKLLGAVDFDLDGHRDDAIKIAIEKMDKHKDEIRAKAEAEIVEIERRKAELLALPHLEA